MHIPGLLCILAKACALAPCHAAKMGCKAAALERALWGDYAYQPKSKRIVRIKQEQYGSLKPLFVQLALEPLWKVSMWMEWEGGLACLTD